MVTIEDILKLPCMKDASIIAGKNTLHKEVHAVSVLEYAQSKKEGASLFSDMEVQPNELVLTAFASIPEDVESQCESVRQMYDNGTIGILLYYVGIFVPKVDNRLISLADELDFTIICMPENKMNLRYSDAIREITAAILTDDASSCNFVSNIIRRVSQLPAEQRNMDVMLRMAAELYNASLALIDGENHIINYAGHQKIPLFRAQHIWETFRQNPDITATVEGFQCELVDIRLRHANALSLIVIRESGDTIKDTKPLKEAIEIFSEIWSTKHGTGESAELLRGIFQDEPLLIFRLAAKLRIDLNNLHGMLVVFPSRQEANLSGRILDVMRQQFTDGQLMLGDVYDGSVVLFIQRQLFHRQHDFMDFVAESVHSVDSGGKLFGCYYIADLAEARAAMSILKKNYSLTAQIYPGHKWFSLQEAAFASECAEIISAGTDSIQTHLRAIAPLNIEDENLRRELHKTLAVYLLDCGSSVSMTAERMYLHKNTIKYRINRISELLGYHPSEMPEGRELYLSAAIERLLNMRE